MSHVLAKRVWSICLMGGLRIASNMYGSAANYLRVLKCHGGSFELVSPGRLDPTFNLRASGCLVQLSGS